MPRDEFNKRKTKKTKAKRNQELNGKYNSKAVRSVEKRNLTVKKEDNSGSKKDKKK